MEGSPQTSGDRAARAAIAGLWLGVIPALTAGLAIGYLLPPSLTQQNGPAGAIARLAGDLPVTAAAALFIVLVILFHYWRFWLPGGRYLVALPSRWITGAKRRDLELYEQASQLRRLLVTGRSGGPSSAEVLVAALDDALAARDLAGVRTAIQRIEREAAPQLASGRLRYGLGLVGGVALAGVAAILMHRIALQPFRVLSSSMLPTLNVGDDILVDRQAYSETRTPRRGDVVVFHYNLPGQPEMQVKRIIGIPGDRIEMNGDRPIINGWPVPICPVGAYTLPVADGIVGSTLVVEYLGDSAYLTLQGINPDPFSGSVQLDDGFYFVLGDNRSGSVDSRSWNGGRGGGVRMSKIEGWARWILLARSHDGQFDSSRSLRAIGRDFSIEGVDTSELRDRVDRCLRDRPRETLPPRLAPASAAALDRGRHGT